MLFQAATFWGADTALTYGFYSLGSGTGTSSDNKITMTTTREAPAGSTIVVFYGADPSSAGWPSVTDGTNTYTKISNELFSALFYSTNVSALSGGSTITGNFASSRSNRAIVAGFLYGVTTSSLDKSTSATGSGALLDSGSTATLSQATELMIGTAFVSSAVTITDDSSWTTEIDAAGGTMRLHLASRMVTSTSGRRYTPTASGATNWDAFIATFKAA